MASISTSIALKFHQFSNSNKLSLKTSQNQAFANKSNASFNLSVSQKSLGNESSLFVSLRPLLYTSSPMGGGSRCLAKPISAAGSGLEALITDPKDNGITLKKVKIVVESQDEDKIVVRVDVTGVETQKVYNQVLRSLARTAPPIPGFRREKGGKTTNVPTDFLLQILGEDRVTKFVIQEIVSASMADYVKKENLSVKENKINTTETAEELEKLFAPGKEFGFTATLELEKVETDTDSSDDEIESSD